MLAFARGNTMKLVTMKFVLYAVFLLLTLVPYSAMPAPASSDELQPDLGLFAFDTGLEPYFMSIKNGLLGEHRFRLCQVLTIPSFQREWVVYVIREEGKLPTIIYKAMKKHLWSEMMAMIEKQSEGPMKHDISTQVKALSALNKEVEVFSAPISEKTTKLLSSVWTAMLLRTRYPQPNNMTGKDGTTYYVAHVETGKGAWSGNAWSPAPKTNPGILIQIADDMKNYATVEASQRYTLEKKIAVKAKRLLTSLQSEEKGNEKTLRTRR